MSIVTVALLFCVINLTGCLPTHRVQKRATLAEIVGDLTVEEPGIINENCKSFTATVVQLEITTALR